MRFVFDTSVLIDAIHQDSLADDALIAATNKGEAFISVMSLMELTVFNEEGKANQKSSQLVGEELNKVDRLCERLGIKKVSVSIRAQDYALTILKEPRYRSLLGKNALVDSLIIGTGLVKRAYLVTRDGDWFELAQQVVRRARVRVLSPEQVVKEFG